MTSVSINISVPKALHGKIIGTKGATKKDIESDYSVVLTIPSREDVNNNVITITGPNNRSVENAQARILDICDMSNGRIDAEKGFARIEQLRKQKDAMFKRAHETPHGPARQQLMADANLKKEEWQREQNLLGDTLFEQANRGYGVDQIDLHGLTVAQAEAKVIERLSAVNADLKSGKLSTLNIIVGAGHHSGVGGPKIKPAVIEVLRQRSNSYEFTMDEAGGQLFVTSKKQQNISNDNYSFGQFVDSVWDVLSWCFGIKRR